MAAPALSSVRQQTPGLLQQAQPSEAGHSPPAQTKQPTLAPQAIVAFNMPGQGNNAEAIEPAGGNDSDSATSLSGIKMLTQEIDRLDVALEECGRLIQQHGLFMEEKKHLYKAQALETEALTEGYVTLAMPVQDDALQQQQDDKLARAMRHNLKALALHRKACGVEDAGTAALCHRIGFVLQIQCRFDMALKYQRKALAIRKKIFGIHHPVTAKSYHAIGELLHIQGKHNKAMQCYRKALAIQKEVPGVDQGDAANANHGIGRLLHVQGELDKALKHLRKALAIRQEALGPDHVATAASCIAIGLVLEEQGNSALALESYQEALRTCVKAFGLEHIHTITPYVAIGSMLHAQGKLTQALKYYRQALALQERFFGPGHPDAVSSRNEVDKILQTLDARQKARSEFETRSPRKDAGSKDAEKCIVS